MPLNPTTWCLIYFHVLYKKKYIVLQMSKRQGKLIIMSYALIVGSGNIRHYLISDDNIDALHG